MEIQCPNCGSYHVILPEDRVSFFHRLWNILSLGIYDPERKTINDSVRKYKAGITDATCMICAYRFKVSEQVDRKRLAQNIKIRQAGEIRFANEREREKEALKTYPRR